MIGEPNDNSTQKLLESEAFEYKDLIKFGFVESYYNLTLLCVGHI